MSLLISAKTLTQLDSYTTEPYPVLLICGGTGTGKNTAVSYVYDQFIKTKKIAPENTLNVEATGKSITIEQARDIKTFFRLRASNDATRMVIIKRADLLTVEAQNALLKLLEDTPRNALFVMTSLSESALLPTITSRSRTLDMLNPTLSEYSVFYSKDKSDLETQFFMSGGRTAYIDALINNPESEIYKAFEVSKAILASSKYERLLRVEEHIKNDQVDLFIFALKRLTKYLLKRSSKADEQQRLTKNLILLDQTDKYYTQSTPNPKLLINNLLLHL